MKMNLLFSTDTDAGTITVIDLDGDRDTPVARIPVGNGPRGAVRFTKDGKGFVSNHEGNTVSEIDALSLREIQRITVGVAPIGVAIVPGDRFAIVSNSGDNTVSIIDIGARKEIHQIQVGREPRHPDVTPSGDFAYVPISGADYVSKIDLRPLKDSNPKAVREINRIFLGKGTMPYSCAVSPDGKKVVAANNQESYISVISTNEDVVVGKVDVGNKGARGTAFLPDSSIAFVSIEDISEIVAINLTDLTIENRFSAGPGPRGLLFDEASGTIFASAFARTTLQGRAPNSVSVLNFGARTFVTAAGQIPQVTDIRVGAGPCSVSIYRGS